MPGHGRLSAATALALVIAVAYVSSMITPTVAYTPVTCGNGQYKSGDNCYNCASWHVLACVRRSTPHPPAPPAPRPPALPRL